MSNMKTIIVFHRRLRQDPLTHTISDQYKSGKEMERHLRKKGDIVSWSLDIESLRKFYRHGAKLVSEQMPLKVINYLNEHKSEFIYI